MATLTARQGNLWSDEVLSADLTSDLIDVRHQSRVCFIIATTIVGGTAAGTIYFKVKTYEGEGETATALAAPTVTIVAGTAVSTVVEVTDLAAGFIEVFVDLSATGTDTIDISYHVKD